MNQLIHQESVTANLQQLTSNKVTLLPKLVLSFQLSWVNLITIPLIMVMLKFTVHNFKLNLTFNLFYIRTPLWSNQLIMMKCTISCNFPLGPWWWYVVHWPPDSPGFTGVCPYFQILYSLYCDISQRWRRKYCCHKLHVSLFYVIPKKSHCEIG